MMESLPELFTPAVQLTLIIIIVGVGLRTWDGLAGKGKKEFSVNRTIFTFILSCITGIGLVVPHVEAQLAVDGITGTEILLLIGNQIITVFGADALYKGKRTKQLLAKIGGEKNNGEKIQ